MPAFLLCICHYCQAGIINAVLPCAEETSESKLVFHCQYPSGILYAHAQILILGGGSTSAFLRSAIYSQLFGSNATLARDTHRTRYPNDSFAIRMVAHSSTPR